MRKAANTDLPPHPGMFVREKVIAPLGLSIQLAAECLGITRVALSALLNCRASLSPEMALRLEKAFGADMDALVQMQSRYDIAMVRARANEIVVSHVPLSAHPTSRRRGRL